MNNVRDQAAERELPAGFSRTGSWAVAGTVIAATAKRGRKSTMARKYFPIIHRGLDHRPSVVAFLEIEIGHGLVGIEDVTMTPLRRCRCGHGTSVAPFITSTIFSLELIARAELHDVHSHVAIGYGTIPRTAHAVAASDRSPSGEPAQ